jgi:hypothetical protein
MKFWKSGNALIESSLLMAFIAMASASLFLGASGGISHQGNWSTTSSRLYARNGPEILREFWHSIPGRWQPKGRKLDQSTGR